MSIREEINLSDSGSALFFHSFRKLQIPEKSLTDNALGESCKLNESLWWWKGKFKILYLPQEMVEIHICKKRMEEEVIRGTYLL